MNLKASSVENVCKEMGLDLEPTIAPSNEKSFLIFCQKEKDFMVADGYWDCPDHVLKLRDKAAELFGKYSKSKSEAFDPYIPYLAMTYFDRFISRNDHAVLQSIEEDDLVLFCIACLSVAWKFRNRFFSLKNFSVRNRICLDLEAYILEAESELMKGLEWHLRSITPFMYVLYLAKSFAVGKGFNLQLVNEMITKAQGDVGFTKYVPSVIAASAILTCCKLTCRQEFDCCMKRFLAANYFKENGLEASFGRMYSVFVKKNVFPERLNWAWMEDAGHVGTRSENFNALVTNDLNWVLVEDAERVDSALSGQASAPALSESDTHAHPHRPVKEPMHESFKEGSGSEDHWVLVEGVECVDSALARQASAPAVSESDRDAHPHRPGKEPMHESFKGLGSEDHWVLVEGVERVDLASARPASAPALSESDSKARRNNSRFNIR